MRPHEAPALEPLRKQTPPIPAPPENLYPIPRASPKHKEVPAEGIFRKLGLHEPSESIKTLAHVGRDSGQPHPSVRRPCNHPRTRKAITRASTLVSIRPFTTLQCPIPGWLTIAPRSRLDPPLWERGDTVERL